MKKFLGIVLVLGSFVFMTAGCEKPVVTAPDASGLKTDEVPAIQNVSASPGGGDNNNPPAQTQSAETVAPPQ